MTKKVIKTGSPFLPPLEQLIPFLENIWASRNLSNNGHFEKEFEKAIKLHLNVDHVSLVSNATIGLILSIKALRLEGEIITTAYGFAAAAQAITTAGLIPKFIDVAPKTTNLDPSLIEAAITDQTSAILAIHTYGIPCDVDQIERIARKYKLKVIYDAAHAIGVNCHCGSILNHGDFSIVSLHATKLINTFEGGIVISRNSFLKQKIDRLKNFGFSQNKRSASLGFGLNGKMQEFSAALGLIQLQHLESLIQQNKDLAQNYDRQLAALNGVEPIKTPSMIKYNFSYYPIVVTDESQMSRDSLVKCLADENIFTQRYFSESLPKLFSLKSDDYRISSSLRHTKNIAKRVICLPIYPEMTHDLVERVAKTIRKFTEL
ncbi:MAG: DegT/DnrJ/EryC1/StrS family aminotransferase [Gammaproteobacteria bacterium]